jgi:hypothetical protein
MATRLRALEQAEDNFGLPRKPFSNGPDNPEAIRFIEKWRMDERRARDHHDASFFEDLAAALTLLKLEDQAPGLDPYTTPEQIVKRLTAWTAVRMILDDRQALPYQHELIGDVEKQLAVGKYLRSPLAPPLLPGAKSSLHEVEIARRDLLKGRGKNHPHNWRRILKELWLDDFLPVRRGRPGKKRTT